MTTISDSVCTARANAMLTNVPPVRFTPVSPYPEYSQYELDMRRKAEVLKYKKNSGKSNGFTQKQLFVQTIEKKGRSNVTASLRERCSAIDDAAGRPLPAYFSGVPGGGMLYYNPAIPLYNYVPPKPTYAIINNAEEEEETAATATTTATA